MFDNLDTYTFFKGEKWVDLTWMGSSQTSCRHLLVDGQEQSHHQVIDNLLLFVQLIELAPPYENKD